MAAREKYPPDFKREVAMRLGTPTEIEAALALPKGTVQRFRKWVEKHPDETNGETKPKRGGRRKATGLAALQANGAKAHGLDGVDDLDRLRVIVDVLATMSRKAKFYLYEDLREQLGEPVGK